MVSVLAQFLSSLLTGNTSTPPSPTLSILNRHLISHLGGSAQKAFQGPPDAAPSRSNGNGLSSDVASSQISNDSAVQICVVHPFLCVLLC